MNAGGNYVPPMIVFKRKRMIEPLKDGTPPGSVIVNNERNELFVVWLKHFLSHVGCTKDRPVLLILDGHSSHTKNTEAIQYARDHGVVILSLPPHTTHRLQPLDRVFYKSLIAYYIHECDRWLSTEKTTVTISSVCRILGRFQVLWPCDRIIWTDADFAAAGRFELSYFETDEFCQRCHCGER